MTKRKKREMTIEYNFGVDFSSRLNDGLKILRIVFIPKVKRKTKLNNHFSMALFDAFRFSHPSLGEQRWVKIFIKISSENSDKNK